MTEGFKFMKDFVQGIDGVVDSIKGSPMRRTVGNAADLMRDKIKAKTPVGPTGNLRDSVVARMYPAGTKGGKEAFVKVDWKLGKHAHMVESGTGERTLKTARWHLLNGRWVWLTKTGSMPASHFWRKGVARGRTKAKNMIAKGVGTEIDRAWSR